MDTQILIYSPVYGLIAVLTLDNANYGLTQQFIKQCLIYERFKIYNFFRLPLTTLEEKAPYLTRWVKPNFERTVGNRTQGQPGFGASRGLHHETIVAVFVGGYRNGRHNTFPKCQIISCSDLNRRLLPYDRLLTLFRRHAAWRVSMCTVSGK